MAQLKTLKNKLKKGQVYRREDLVELSNAVDRHLGELVSDGTLQKLSHGLYYYPKESVFGKVPPDETTLIRSFLKEDDFLVTSANAYNSLGLGTTQLYNERTVYNHKRRGKFKLGNQSFDFRLKPRFPKKVTAEFLLVDLVNNLELLAEDKTAILKHIPEKVPVMDPKKLKESVSKYGNLKTRKIFAPLIGSLNA